MNDEQIKKAAKELCRLRGIDPEDLVSDGTFNIRGNTLLLSLRDTPAWTVAERELREYLHIHQALIHGLQP